MRDIAKTVGTYLEQASESKKGFCLLVCLSSFAATSELLAQTPPNDLFSNRIALSGTNFVISGSTVGATEEPGELPSGLKKASVWWTWTAQASGPISVDTDHGTTVDIYTGDDLTNLSKIETPAASDYFNATAGTSYQIQVWSDPTEATDFELYLYSPQEPVITRNLRSVNALTGTTVILGIEALSFTPLAYQWTRNGNKLTESRTVVGVHSNRLTLINVTAAAAGTYEVAVSNPYAKTTRSAPLQIFAPALNDMFANRIKVQGTNLTLSGHNVGATLEPGEPANPTTRSDASVWWTWKAPLSGTMTRFDGPLYLSQDRVFTGDTITNLTSIPVGDKRCFSVVAGTTYQIRFSSDADKTGAFTLKYKFQQTPLLLDVFAAFPLEQGSWADLYVTALSGSPLSYHWRRNGINLVDGANINGAQSNHLILTNVTYAEATAYSVTVSNEYGSDTFSPYRVFPVNRITNGIPITVSAGTATSYAVISVPTGQTRLSISSTNATSLELYHFGSVDYANYHTETNRLTVATPEAGNWLIGGSIHGGTLTAGYSSDHPALGNLQLNKNGLTVPVSGLEGWLISVLETSSNLHDWIPVMTNSASGDSVMLSNAVVSGTPRAFFRTVVYGSEPYFVP
jgi:hypothetical protein